jgi:hypothetical protein
MFLFLACLLAMPQQSHAEDKAKAVELLQEGDALLQKGDRYWAANKPEKGIAAYEEALKIYNEAYKAFNSPKIFYPIAEAEQKLFLYLEAMAHYQALLKEAENLDPELVEQAQAAIVEVRKNLSGLTLTVEQDGAVVVLDEQKLGTTPLSGVQYFKPGRHTYSVTLDGYTPHEETMETKRGEVLERKVTLETMPVVVEKKGKKSKKVVVSSTPNKTPMTISFGLAGGFVIGATFTAIQANARHDRYQDETVSDADREKARDRGKSYRLATDVLLGGAVLAAGYGTYYYYYKYKPQKREQALAKVWVSPYASGDGGGLAMGASF